MEVNRESRVVPGSPPHIRLVSVPTGAPFPRLVSTEHAGQALALHVTRRVPVRRAAAPRSLYSSAHAGASMMQPPNRCVAWRSLKRAHVMRMRWWSPAAVLVELEAARAGGLRETGSGWLPGRSA